VHLLSALLTLPFFLAFFLWGEKDSWPTLHSLVCRGGFDVKLVAFVVVGLLTLAYVVAELGVAIWVGSLALLSDGYVYLLPPATPSSSSSLHVFPSSIIHHPSFMILIIFTALASLPMHAHKIPQPERRGFALHRLLVPLPLSLRLS